MATHALSQMHVSKACKRKKLPLEAGTEGYEDLFLHILLYLYSIQSGGGRDSCGESPVRGTEQAYRTLAKVVGESPKLNMYSNIHVKSFWCKHTVPEKWR